MTTKVEARHLDRKAIVYVRQSSPNQVLMHRESAALQYGLVNRAVALGWSADRVEVIDQDQGKSGQSVEGRLGFQHLLAEVALDHVGIILGIEMSRLARSCKDWHQLLEVCSLFQTLLADQDGVYDPTAYNDRLLLGLKGTMSEAELHILQGRLKQGLWNKARRGEMFNHAPVGYIRNPAGKMIIDPDEQVQGAVRMVFDKFEELGSASAVLQYFAKNSIKIGVRVHAGPNRGKLEWRHLCTATLHSILKHPIYAGAYRFGHRPVDNRTKKPGKRWSGRLRRGINECEVLIKDIVPSYINWGIYEYNLKRLSENRSFWSSVSAPRKGASLLCGLIRCGLCGRRMTISYSVNKNTFRYSCLNVQEGFAQPGCQSFSGVSVDKLVENEILEILRPASLELVLAVCDNLKKENERLLVNWKQKIERAQYEVNRTFRQYDQVDPENRLVARNLEKNWEIALQEQRTIKEDFDRYQATHRTEYTATELESVRRLAENIPELWHAESTSVQDRKEIVRILLERAVVRAITGTNMLDVTLHWIGGIQSKHEIQRSIAGFEQMKDYNVLLERAMTLSAEGLTYQKIANILDAEGWRPPRRSNRFNKVSVSSLLQRHLNRRRSSRYKLGENEWLVGDLANKLEMPGVTVTVWAKKKNWISWRRLGPDDGAEKSPLVLWADEGELKRLRDLRSWSTPQRRGPHCKAPPHLTTPKVDPNTQRREES